MFNNLSLTLNHRLTTNRQQQQLNPQFMLLFSLLFPHVTRVLDSTTSTSFQSSLEIVPTPSRHHHEPLQRLQHPPNASTASSSSPLQKKPSNSIPLVNNDSTRPHPFERHVDNDILDYRRLHNALATPPRAASTMTSCCCPIAASSSSTTGTRLH